MTGKNWAYSCVTAVAVGLLCLGQPADAQQRLTLTADQGRALAVNSFAAGNLREAVILANGVLTLEPGDFQSLMILTQAALQIEDYGNATTYGSQAFWNAGTNPQRYNAARLTALGHARQEQFSRAQLWLRLARQNAPNAAAAETVAKDFQAVRQQNPWTVNLRFGVSPSTNINGGSSSEVFEFLGLPFVLSEDAQALSGWEYSASADLRYRLRTDRTSATFLDFGLSGRTFTLTEGSRDRLERDGSDVEGSDFSDATLSFGLTHRFVIAPDANVTTAALSYARSFKEDDQERQFVTASLSHAFDINGGDSLRLSSFFQRQRRIENGDEAQVFDLNATYSTQLENIGSFSFGIGARDNLAENPSEDFDSWRYRLFFAPAEPWLGVNYGFSASYEEREFQTSSFVEGVRTDEITSFGVRAVLSDVEFFGFQPVVTFDRTRQRSNSDLFNRDYSEFGFDIVSAF